MSNFSPQGDLNETQPYASRAAFPEANQGGPYESGTQNQPPIQVTVVKKRSPCGCFFAGCLGVVIVGTIVAGISGYVGYRYWNSLIAKYTSDSPRELPSANISEEEVEAVAQRLNEFAEQFDAGEAPQELELTVDEINAMLSKDPEMRGKIHVSTVDDNLKAEVSVPLDSIWGGKGRYFNGSATLQVKIEDGFLDVYLIDAEANGESIPEAVIQEIRKQNLAGELNSDPEMSKTIRRCEALIIQGDRIILKVRPVKAKDAGDQPIPPSDDPLDDASASSDAEDVSEAEEVPVSGELVPTGG